MIPYRSKNIKIRVFCPLKSTTYEGQISGLIDFIHCFWYPLYMARQRTSIYSNSKVRVAIQPLKDAIGRELAVEDYVTAVFSDAKLTLFQITGFERESIEYKMHDKPYKTDVTDYIVLRRIHGTNAHVSDDYRDAKSFNSKLVYKTSMQVAYADPSYVLLHYLGA